MKEHVNFYENIKEADMRLTNTIITYDGDPYYVLCITDHKQDGILRMYLDPLGRESGQLVIHEMGNKGLQVPYEWYQDGPSSPTRGQKMDEFLDKNPDCGIIRKMMNSPLFNKFRPFPLGMVNYRGAVTYVERQPTRHTQQGLMSSMMSQIPIGLEKLGNRRPNPVDMNGRDMYNTIKGLYPSVDECVKNLNNPDIANTAVAFDRHFAFVRGPLGILFLAYKHDIVGYLPHGDLSSVVLGIEFGHTKEVVSALGVFKEINFAVGVTPTHTKTMAA